MKRFREGLVFKAHTLVLHSNLGSRVIKKKEEWAGPHNHDPRNDELSDLGLSV